MPPELQPLGVDGSKPATASSTIASDTTAAAVTPAASSTSSDPVAEFLAEQGQGTETTATTTAAATTATTTTTTDAATSTPTEAATASATTAPATTQPDPAKPVAEATATPAGETKPAEAQPVAKPTLAAEEKFTIAEGVEWTRAQIEHGLRERVGAIREADAFRAVFGMTAADAEKAWKPVLQRLREHPEDAAFISAFFEQPEKAKYLQQCARFFDEENAAVTGAQPNATEQPAAATDPVLAREVTELKQWKAERQQIEAQGRLNAELAQLTQRFPILAHDRELLGRLVRYAGSLWQQDNSKGLLDAATEWAPMIEAMQVARSAQTSSTAQPAVTAAPPATLSSGAPAPTSTRPDDARRTGDPVRDWMEVDGPKAGFG